MDKLTQVEKEWVLDILLKERERLMLADRRYSMPLDMSSEHETLTNIIVKIDSSLNPTEEE